MLSRCVCGRHDMEGTRYVTCLSRGCIRGKGCAGGVLRRCVYVCVCERVCEHV